MSCSFLQQCKNCNPHVDFATKCSRLPFQEITLQHVSPNDWGYRYRISMRPNKQGELGYYQPQSHNHVLIPKCAISHPKINETLQRLPPLPVPVSQVDIKTNGSKVICNLIDKKHLTPERRKHLSLWAQNVDGCSYNGKNFYKDATLSYRFGGIHHRISSGTFTQVNLDINNILIERIVHFVDYFSPTKILDLYSGCGNLSFPLLQKGYNVEMMEIAPSSVKDANRNLTTHNFVGQATIHQKDANRFQAGDAFFDLAILDPPRKGGGTILQQLAITKPKAIIYVSCNPNALYKEMKQIQKYTCIAIEAFDMFPQTKHVEVLAVFERDI